VTADLDGVVAVYDRERALLMPRVSSPAPFIALAISSTSRVVAIATSDRRMRIYQLTGSGLLLEQTRDANVKRLAFAPLGEKLAAICVDGTVRAWDLAAGISRAVELPLGTVMGIAFGKQGTTIAATTATGMHLVEVADIPAIPSTLDDVERVGRQFVRRFDAPARATPEERQFLYEPRNARD
jgi:WD40 repeat protein